MDDWQIAAMATARAVEDGGTVREHLVELVDDERAARVAELLGLTHKEMPKRKPAKKTKHDDDTPAASHKK